AHNTNEQIGNLHQNCAPFLDFHRIIARFSSGGNRFLPLLTVPLCSGRFFSRRLNLPAPQGSFAARQL
ncbi:MAG: hypothetical protein II010_07445, partial [Oscillospiraceae bacterium]|nr:hypothetical protein [Oscillospiraceae bacterium]